MRARGLRLDWARGRRAPRPHGGVPTEVSDTSSFGTHHAGVSPPRSPHRRASPSPPRGVPSRCQTPRSSARTSPGCLHRGVLTDVPRRVPLQVSPQGVRHLVTDTWSLETPRHHPRGPVPRCRIARRSSCTGDRGVPPRCQTPRSSARTSLAKVSDTSRSCTALARPHAKSALGFSGIASVTRSRAPLSGITRTRARRSTTVPASSGSHSSQRGARWPAEHGIVRRESIWVRSAVLRIQCEAC